MNGSFDVPYKEGGLAGVCFHSLGKFMQISEGLLCSVNTISAGLIGDEEVVKQIPFASLGIHQQVVHNGPRFGVEHRGTVVLVVIRGRMVRLKECRYGDELVLLEDLKVVRRDLADFDVVVVNHGVAEVLGDTFVEPDRQIAKIDIH